MRRLVMISAILLLGNELFAEYVTTGINLGLRATQMLLNENKARKKEKREAELHKQKMEKTPQTQDKFKELATLLQFRYSIKLSDVENNPLFWQYAEKTIVRKGETSDITIMKCLEKNEHTNAALIINAVVNRMKKDGKWPPEKNKKRHERK